MLENELLTIQEVSRILDVHSKTVRRYINEGTIKANKLGGQWRIKTEDLKMFMSGEDYTKSNIIRADESLKGFIEGENSKAQGRIQVCTIIDVYVDFAEEVNPICQAMLGLMNSEDEDQKNAKFQYNFVPAEKKARFTLWGNPKFLAKMLNIVAEATQ